MNFEQRCEDKKETVKAPEWGWEQKRMFQAEKEATSETQANNNKNQDVKNQKAAECWPEGGEPEKEKTMLFAF